MAWNLEALCLYVVKIWDFFQLSNLDFLVFFYLFNISVYTIAKLSKIRIDNFVDKSYNTYIMSFYFRVYCKYHSAHFKYIFSK